MNRLAVNLILRHRAVTNCIPKTAQNRQFVIQQSCKITNSNIEEESFGIGSKYAQLDTTNSTEQQSTNKKRISIDSDKFKSNHLNDNEYYSKIGYKKPLSDIKYDAKAGEEEQEEIERNYEKILKHKPLSNDPNKREHTERYYSNKILDLFRRKRHKEAIDVFFVEMIEKDRFKPSIWLYKVMMRELAYIGDIDTVFSLFKRMIGSHDQEWKLPKYKAIIDKIITILFTACAKTNDAEFVIRKCNSIRTFLKNKGIEMNRYHYISAISAYGRSGAIYEAFNLVDEMLKDESVASAIRKRILSVDVFNNMLCACISQPEYGFRYALMTWQMCLTYKIRPNLTTYELLLKAAKDCTMCSSNELVRLNPSSNSDKSMTDKEAKTLNIEDQTQSSVSSVEKTITTTTTTTTTKNEDASVIELKSENVSIIDEVRLAGEQLEKEVKNLEWWQDIKSNVNRENLARAVSKIRPELKEIILARNFDSILTRELDETDKDSLFEFITQDDDTPSGRLFMCTGGLDGFLTAMRAHSVRPSLKTFQLLARIVPDDLESENELIDRMRDLNIDMDIDFINALIRRRAFRGEKTEVDDAFNMIQKEQLTPNIHTFGGLAYCLGSKNDLIEFLENLESFNLKLNPIILSTLFLRASRRRDIGFTKYLLDYISQKNVGVNQKFIDKIDSTLDRFKKNIIEYERSSNKKNDELEIKTYERTRNFYNWLSGYYPKWIETVKKL